MELDLIKRITKTTAPRWIIFGIDLIIVALSCLFVMTSSIFAGSQIGLSEMTFKIAAIVCTYGVFSWIFKSYAYIIRLSVLDDLFRLLAVAGSSLVFLWAINAYELVAGKEMWITWWFATYSIVLAFTLQTCERLCIKHLYMRISPKHDNRKRVIVFGTTFNALVIANALRAEITGKYLPVAVVSSNNGEKRKSVNDLDVYPLEDTDLKEVVEKYKAQAVIVGPYVMNKTPQLVEAFLNLNVRLYSINRLEEINSEELEGNSEKSMSCHVRDIQIEDLLGRDPIVTDNTLVRQHIHGECVMITGAAGSIGSEIVRQVASYGASHIVLLDQAETPMHDMHLEIREKFPNVPITLFVADIQNRERVELAFKQFRPKYLFHAAAYKHVPMMEMNPTEAILTNIMGTRIIAELAIKYEVYKFVMISTDKAVNPTNIMGCTKRCAEVLTQTLFFHSQKEGTGKTQFITTRFGNVLGSNGSVIPLFRSQIEKGGPVTVTHKDIIRYFMTIPEACSLVLEAGCMGNGGEVYVFDMGQPMKIYDLATRMISLAGLRPNVDIKIVETGLRPGEKLYEELLNNKENTTATINKKIMIAKVITYDYDTVCKSIDEIVEHARHNDVHGMVLAMKHFIPEFKSRNSVFESVDKEIEAENQNKA